MKRLSFPAFISIALAAAGALRPASAQDADPAAPAAAESAPATDLGVPTPPLSQTQRALLDATDPAMLAAWDTDAGLREWLPEPTGEGNAAAHFFKLAELYPKEKDGKKVTVPPDSQGVQELLAAARIKVCRLSPDFYPPVDSGDTPQPDYIVLLSYTRALLQYAGRLADRGDVAGAEEAFRAGLVCGRHLTDDATSLLVYLAGLSMKRRSAEAYARFLRASLRNEEAVRLEDYAVDLRNVAHRVQLKSQYLLGNLKHFNSLPAIIRVARGDQRLFWRQEAVMRLGVLRWGAPAGAVDAAGKAIMDHDEAWQQAAAATLEWVGTHDADPSMQRLAVWSFQQLTPEKFIDMRHRALVVRSTED